MGRTIIFGDIHGCCDEWEELLRLCEAGPEDRLVAVGDLICKGPSSRRTLDLAMRLSNLQCVMGNHDFFILSQWEAGNLDNLPHPYQQQTVSDLRPRLNSYMNHIAAWPYYVELDDCIVVHAGLRPGLALEEQSHDDLLYLRTLTPEGPPWYDAYEGEKLVVHGHWAKQGLVVREHVIGLDSGCVYGGKLSAVILPEKRIVSVDAKKVYCPIGS